MNIVDKYNIKFTMWELLNIEREFDKNLLDSSLLEDVKRAEDNLHAFFNREVKPFREATSGKELNAVENAHMMKLGKEVQYLENKVKYAKYLYFMEILSYFTNDECRDDEEINLSNLIEFYNAYIKATEQKFKVPTKDSDTGKRHRLNVLGGFMHTLKKNVGWR